MILLQLLQMTKCPEDRCQKPTSILAALYCCTYRSPSDPPTLLGKVEVHSAAIQLLPYKDFWLTPGGLSERSE